MTAALETIREGLGPDPGPTRVLVECPHGRTSGVVLSGAKALPDDLVLDLMRARHAREHRCSCSRVQHGSAPTPELAARRLAGQP